jgi:hypothetical protein
MDPHVNEDPAAVARRLRPGQESTTGVVRTPEGSTPDPTPVLDGQHAAHWVLSAEERAKGFVRPVRARYQHVGPPAPGGLRDLTAEEMEQYRPYGYVKFEPYPDSRAPVTGRYWTQAQLDKARGGGCGGVTTMGSAIAETYAREPSFYGSTWCCGCRAYLPVGETGEFVWDGTDERVGT